MSSELLSTEELSRRVKYDVRTIRERLKHSVLLEEVHDFRPFGGRKIFYIWAVTERALMVVLHTKPMGMSAIPMANGGGLHA